MRNFSRIAKIGFPAVVLTAALSSCSAGDLTFSNESPADVKVFTGDQEYVIEGWGGVSILGAGCSTGDITVDFGSGELVVVEGPVCPDERVVIGEGTAYLQPNGRQ